MANVTSHMHATSFSLPCFSVTLSCTNCTSKNVLTYLLKNRYRIDIAVFCKDRIEIVSNL